MTILCRATRIRKKKSYRSDDESPSHTTVTVHGADGEPEYRVDQGYGEYTVYSPGGHRLGTFNHGHEAEGRILEHALDNYGPEGDDNSPQYETRTVPQDNITVPEVHGGARFESYKLPGLINYREVPFSFEPREGEPDFSRSHFDTNTLGHMRVCEWHDDEGRRLLHLDEIQSDLHQKGADEGYYDPNSAQKQQVFEAAKQKLGAARKTLSDALDLPTRANEDDQVNPGYTHSADMAALALQPNGGFAMDHFRDILRRMLPEDLKKATYGDNWEKIALFREMHQEFKNKAAGVLR